MKKPTPKNIENFAKAFASQTVVPKSQSDMAQVLENYTNWLVNTYMFRIFVSKAKTK